MSFNFGSTSTTPAPAPTGGGFSFASTTPAPAPFGSTSAPAPLAFGSTPAPSTGFGAAPSSGGLFGGAGGSSSTTPGFGSAAPAPSLFGGAPGAAAPAPSFGGFGSPAPAPGFGGFGSSAPAPAFGFGSPAPAPAFGGFGTPAPAPAFGGFSSPAPATGFGAPPQQQQQQSISFTPKTLYKDLPPEAQRLIDRVHDAIMDHRRTMARVKSMAPRPLVEIDSNHSSSTSKDDKTTPLQQEILKIKKEMESKLVPETQSLLEQITALHQEIRKVMASAIMHASWPTEALANTRGIRLAKSEEKKEERVDQEVYALLERLDTSRIERLPSPFFWQALDDMQEKYNQLQILQDQIKSRAQQQDWDDMSIVHIMFSQDEQLYRIRNKLGQLHAKVDQVRALYKRVETRFPNVIDEADMKEAELARQEAESYQATLLHQVAQQPGQQPATPGFGGAPAPAFGAPAPGSSLFGSTAPAPSGSFFAPTPAPGSAPALGGGLFGSSPAPAATGFGATPAPSTGLFGAPAPGTSAFGSTASFGATTTQSFGAPASSTSSASRKPGSKSRGGRSRR